MHYGSRSSIAQTLTAAKTVFGWPVASSVFASNQTVDRKLENSLILHEPFCAYQVVPAQHGPHTIISAKIAIIRLVILSPFALTPPLQHQQRGDPENVEKRCGGAH